MSTAVVHYYCTAAQRHMTAAAGAVAQLTLLG